jgi:hypothetical protein
MSLITSLSRFARSPQGRRLAQQAVRVASDPKTKRQIQSARQRLIQRGKRA